MTDAPQSPSVELRSIQSAIGEWQQREFRPNGIPADLMVDTMLVVEECGETARCFVKRNQNIRGGADHWTAELRKEQADVVVTVLALGANHHIDVVEGLDVIGWGALLHEGDVSPDPSRDTPYWPALRLGGEVGRLSEFVEKNPEGGAANPEWWFKEMGRHCSRVIEGTMNIAWVEGFDWFDALRDRWGEVSTRRFATKGSNE
jgi:hypothetical protein